MKGQVPASCQNLSRWVRAELRALGAEPGRGPWLPRSFEPVCSSSMPQVHGVRPEVLSPGP